MRDLLAFEVREEHEIFTALEKLCVSPGYAHALAFLCFRDNIVKYGEEMTADDMLPLFSQDRLIRTEISTLVGLMVKREVDYALPSPTVIQQYMDDTEALLKEMHEAMKAPMISRIQERLSGHPVDPFDSGDAMREPIFYGGESAYIFQYRDLSLKKYEKDDPWLLANKGFAIKTARDVIRSVAKFQDEKRMQTVTALRGLPPEQWTVLPGLEFSIGEVAKASGVEAALVEKVLTAFSLGSGVQNGDFRTIHDFNAVNAFPLLHTSDGEFLLFQAYSFAEALYDTPFYWMGDDDSYVSTAMGHRGMFTEELSRDRLARVFGTHRVHQNVLIVDPKGDHAGEIDVLVIFGNRAIVLQAKSKKLTLEARRGNDGQIRDDFKKSVQESYDQAWACAELLTRARYRLIGSNSKEIVVPNKLERIYPLCVVSDHYPALSFQVRQFLKFQTNEIIAAPFVMDVFTVDVLTEMLESPLRLLSYVDRRASYGDRVFASHELTILSYHLKRNLWIASDLDMVQLGDDISSDLDVAMLVRREGVPGKRTPDGILTHLAGTSFERIVQEIERRPDPSTIDLGFTLLSVSGNTATAISEHIDKIASLARADGRNHDATIGFGDGQPGLTIHCNEAPISSAGSSLERHCAIRKYIARADSWFGVCLLPGDASIRFGVNLASKWEKRPELDAIVQRSGVLRNSGTEPRSKRPDKVGRNDPCPCGSGKKYKKCHGA